LVVFTTAALNKNKYYNTWGNSRCSESWNSFISKSSCSKSFL